MPEASTSPSNGQGPSGSSRTNGSTAPNGFPCLRSGLQIIPRARQGAYLLMDPESGESFELGEKEFYICGQLDGHTPPEEVRDRLEHRFAHVVEPEAFEALIRQLVRQRVLVTAESEAIHYPLGPATWVAWEVPSWVQVDAIFTWLEARLRWCFTTPVAVGAGAFTLLGLAAILKDWSAFKEGAAQALFVDFPWLMGLSIMVGVMLFQAIATGVACKHVGARVRSFRLEFYFFIPYFGLDLDDMRFVSSKRNRYGSIWAGYASEMIAFSFAATMWSMTPPSAPLREFWLMLSWALFLLFPWNPLMPRRAYHLLCEWLEIPDLGPRARFTAWSWIFGMPEPEPFTRKQRIGFRVYGTLWFLYFALLLGGAAWLATPQVVKHVDVTGLALVLVAAAFTLEFPMRKELMRFEPFLPWLVKNDGKSTAAWVTRLGLASLILLAMLLPYPYEPGGDLRILPVRQEGIRTQVQGKIQEIVVEEGDMVEAGQIVARIDRREYERNVKASQADLESTKAQLRLLEEGPKPEDVGRAREQMATTEAAYFYSRREAQRFEKLYKEKVVSINTYENKLEERDVNAKLYETARQNLALVMSGPRPDAIEAQSALVRQKEAIAEDARKELDLTVITTPVSGRVVTPRPKDKVGQSALVGDLIVGVEDSRTLRAEVQVPEQTTGQIKPGAPVKVKAWTFPNRTFKGEVVSVAPVVVYKKKEGTVDYLATEREDSMSRATTSDPGRIVRVLVSIPNPDGLLKSEMTGYAKVRVGYEPFGMVMTHGLIRFFRVEVWSWIP